MKKLSLILVGLLALSFIAIAGCATTTVPFRESKPVPSERVIDKELTKSDSIRDVKITFIRDHGFLGSGCYAVLIYNDKKIAKLNSSESVSFYVSEGEHIFAVTSGDKGLCSMGHYFEHLLIVRKTRANTFRIRLDPSGTVLILPTGHRSVE